MSVNHPDRDSGELPIPPPAFPQSPTGPLATPSSSPLPPPVPPRPEISGRTEAGAVPDVGDATRPVATPIPMTPAVPATPPTANRPIPVRPILVPQAASASDGTVLAGVSSEPDEETFESNETQRFLKAAPPWMVSLIVHMVGIVILGLLFFPPSFKDVLQLEAVFSESVGDQLDDFVELNTIDSKELEQAIVDEEMMLVDDPLATPPLVELPADAMDPVAEFTAPTIGIALKGRDVGMKKALLKAYGGTAETEAAVQMGLEWLRRRQERKGSWSLVGPYSKGADTQNRVAATSMALLAFQGAGHTHQNGKYEDEVARGWKFLLAQQDKEGLFFKSVMARNHRFYTHAQATIAICEMYGMTRDPMLKEPAQAAIDYLVETQSAEGGWRYYPKSGADLSVTGWVVMALQSGRMAGLIVPSPVFERIRDYLDTLEDQGGSRYGYLAGDAFTESMTAEGLLCRQYLGWRQDDPRLISGSNYLLVNPVEWRNANFYYWYYATQVLHHMEGDYWDRWNEVMRVEIPNRQEKVGKERGSWYSEEDRFASSGGRLYTTCLSIFMLEVYYRHLPIYTNMYGK